MCLVFRYLDIPVRTWKECIEKRIKREERKEERRGENRII